MTDSNLLWHQNPAKPDDLASWLTYIEAQHPKSIAMGLERVIAVKELLKLSPSFTCITVAGTNGKGSTCAMLERIYLEAGYQVGCYTSPHFLRYNERVHINGEEATYHSLAEALAAVEQARGNIPLTYFEFSTLAAIWLFMQAKLDVAILEVGLGGRLDAVNAFDADCAIVTSIDLDHMEYLGNTRELIGYEKAGVYRANTPAICGDLIPPKSLREHAQTIGAKFMQIQEAFDFSAHSHSWDYHQHQNDMLNLPMPALKGNYQLQNASCAIAAIQCLQGQLPVSYQAIAKGLTLTTLTARFQQVLNTPLTILDVAHNPHAANALAENLRQYPVSGKTYAVFAMLADKDIPGVIAALKDEIDAWFVAGIASARGASSDMVKKHFENKFAKANIQCCENIVLAYRQACKEVGVNDRIIVFGSFYTVADVMSFLSEKS